MLINGKSKVLHFVFVVTSNITEFSIFFHWHVVLKCNKMINKEHLQSIDTV